MASVIEFMTTMPTSSLEPTAASLLATDRADTILPRSTQLIKNVVRAIERSAFISNPSFSRGGKWYRRLETSQTAYTALQLMVADDAEPSRCRISGRTYR